MAPTGAAADWSELGKLFYRKRELYQMLWREQMGGGRLDDELVACARYGGPVAVVRDDRKLTRLGAGAHHQSKPTVRIFTAAGRPLVSFAWEEPGRLVAMGWSDDEVLLCVEQGGNVLPYSVHGELQPNQFSLGSEVAAAGIAECQLWGSGLVVLTNTHRLYAVTSLVEPRVQCLADPMLDCAPSCIAVIPPHNTASGLVEVLVAANGSIWTVDAEHVQDQNVAQGLMQKMAVAPNGQLVACFTHDGRLVVMSTNFAKMLPEFSTKSEVPPRQMVWCGVDSVMLYWEEVLLMVGPYGDWVKYTYDQPLVLAPECDGVRVLTRTQHEFLQRVPEAVVSVCGVGSFSPGALLLDALELFDAQDAHADENLRLIGDGLTTAVEECISAACQEFDITLQRSLLRAAAYGRTFLPSFPPDQLADACKTLRVLNAVRAADVGLPLSMAQYLELTPPTLVMRLVSTHKHMLASRIAEALELREERARVLLHWAATTIAASTQVADAQLLPRLLAKLRTCAHVSFAQVAAAAHRRGRPRLAAALLDYEPRAAEQVPLLTAMGEDERALVKALESGDTDLAYLAVFHLWRKCQFGEFVKVIDQHPQARNLFLAYCRRTDPELLKSYQFSVGAACEAADAIAVEAWAYNAPKFLERQPVGVADVTFQSRLLNQAADLYSKSKDHTLQHTACMESARLLRAQADLERATKQYVYIGLSLHQTLSLLILHNRSTTVMELKHEFKVSDKHLWWIKVNALTSKKDWHALEALAKERKSPIGYEPFARACMGAKAPTRETAKFIARVVDLTLRAQLYAEVGMVHEAAEAQAAAASTSDTSVSFNRIQNLFGDLRQKLI